MKNLIVFLLLIAVAVTAYVLLDDYFQANEDSFNNMQYEQSIIKTPSKLQNMPTSTGVISTGIVTTTSIISTFTANGTEPFWAADFSGTTLARQSPDLGNITISGLVGPVTSGSSLVWTDVGSATTIIIIPGSCTNGMSEQVFSGSINLTITGQNLQGCVSY